ncbi:BON domain-containing protein [Gemmata sp. G18]|uniref:BON domain-containing protein n=1 Tax=Gemmata palustris TaxID=2822762 RepID=A0ABS5BZ15_9BACT|nr:BON domain-containing protein [Gemmata palustris]MBP3958975.1 BON domain-containing protein [Gemmata palustris]
MHRFKTWVWVVAIAGATAHPAFAQNTGNTGNTGTSGTSGTSTGSTLGSSIGSSLGSSTLTGSSSAIQTVTAPDPPSAPTGTATSSSAKSNFLSGYFANPYYQGINNKASSTPGGFGAALYGTTGATGTTGRTGATGARGTQSTANQSGILIPLPVQIHYAAQMRFPTPPVPAIKLQTDLRGIIDAGGFANSKSVQIIADGNNVILRGTVKDDEEARLAEGLVRLTPGVGNITNELTFPVASK